MAPRVIGALDHRFWWWISRSSGIVAWLVVAAAVVWGLLASTKAIRRRGVPAWILDMHRYLGTLTLVFVAVHVAAVWADSFVHFGPKELFVPLTATWRPHAVAWGIISSYLVVAIQVTSWAMRKLPRAVWHRIHVTSIPMLVMATVHGFLAGTDRGNRLVQWSAIVVLGGVTFLLGMRARPPSKPARIVPADELRRRASHLGTPADEDAADDTPEGRIRAGAPGRVQGAARRREGDDSRARCLGDQAP